MNMRAARIGRIVRVLSALALVTGSVTVHAMTLSFERTWGGSASESGEGVAVAPDGSVYLTGQTSSFGTGVADGDLDIFLIKYSADGGILWERIWGEGGESPRGMAIGGDGSIYVVGFTFFFGAGQGDAFLLKYAPDGTILMQKTWGGTNFDIADDVAVAADGSIYVAGDGNSFFANDAFLVKFTPAGGIIWERTWDARDSAGASGIAVAPDGNIASKKEATPAAFLGNSTGTVTTPAGTVGDPNGIVLTPDGSESFAGGSDAVLLRIAP